MTERKIKLDGVVKTINISDGIGKMPFGMNGAGGMTFLISGKSWGDNCFCENRNMLDGEVNFTHEQQTINCSWYEIFKVDDQRQTDLKAIHGLTIEQCEQLDKQKKVNTVLFGLKYQTPNYFSDGYRFGREVTYDDFCVTFDSKSIVAYKSSHNSYIAPNYLTLSIEDKNFKKVYRAIKKSINSYFEL